MQPSLRYGLVGEFLAVLIALLVMVILFRLALAWTYGRRRNNCLLDAPLELFYRYPNWAIPPLRRSFQCRSDLAVNCAAVKYNKPNQNRKTTELKSMPSTAAFGLPKLRLYPPDSIHSASIPSSLSEFESRTSSSPGCLTISSFSFPEDPANLSSPPSWDVHTDPHDTTLKAFTVPIDIINNNDRTQTLDCFALQLPLHSYPGSQVNNTTSETATSEAALRSALESSLAPSHVNLGEVDGRKIESRKSKQKVSSAVPERTLTALRRMSSESFTKNARLSSYRPTPTRLPASLTKRQELKTPNIEYCMRAGIPLPEEPFPSKSSNSRSSKRQSPKPRQLLAKSGSAPQSISRVGSFSCVTSSPRLPHRPLSKRARSRNLKKEAIERVMSVPSPLALSAISNHSFITTRSGSPADLRLQVSPAPSSSGSSARGSRSDTPISNRSGTTSPMYFNFPDIRAARARKKTKTKSSSKKKVRFNFSDEFESTSSNLSSAYDLDELRPILKKQNLQRNKANFYEFREEDVAKYMKASGLRVCRISLPQPEDSLKLSPPKRVTVETVL